MNQQTRADAARRARRLDFFALRHEDIHSLDRLRQQLQTAIQLELATVPLYLTAAYSMKDKTSAAFQTTISVAVEEMLHVNQATNLLIAVGGVPIMTGAAAPHYPTYLPSANRDATPYVTLSRATVELFADVLMAIETPAPAAAPAQGMGYDTIGQFYEAIRDGIHDCVARLGPQEVFQQQPSVDQRTDIYIGRFGGRPIRVHDLESADLAITQIVQQGEGAVDPTQPLVPRQRWGSYNHYGMRKDRTYGPILGTPFELSHYYKFANVADGIVPIGSTYPIASAAPVGSYGNQTAKDLSAFFDAAYSLTLLSMERSFSTEPGADQLYFQVTLPLMHEVLPQVALTLMQTPIWDDGDATVGPTAMPKWDYVDAPSLSDLLDMARSSVRGVEADLAHASGSSAVASLDQILAHLRRALTKTRELGQRCEALPLSL